MLLGACLTLHFAADNTMVRMVGDTLIVIVLLWRLLLYLRETQPAAEHLRAIEQLELPMLNLTAPSLSSEHTLLLPTADAREQDERTPIQRLFTDDK